MSAGRWNQSALKPHLVSNGKNIKDYYPWRQKKGTNICCREHMLNLGGQFLREAQ